MFYKKTNIIIYLATFLYSYSFVNAEEIQIQKQKKVADDDFFDIGNSKKDNSKKNKKISKVRINSIPKTVENPNLIKNKKEIILSEIKAPEPYKYKTKNNKENLLERIDGETVYKSNKEVQIENKFYNKVSEATHNIILKNIELKKSINKKLEDLYTKKDTLKNDYKTYEIELKKIIRSRMQNRYATKTLQEAKMELYDARQKHHLDMEEINQVIETLKKFPKKSKDYNIIYNNIESKRKLIDVSKKEFKSLKKDYYKNKLILRKRYYKELEELKEKYMNNKKKLNIYYELRTNTLINEIN